MFEKHSLGLNALDKALRTRQSLGYGITDTVNIYDMLEALNIEVRFVEAKSLEGMYYKGQQPHIIVSSLRPSSRQAFTCAHELGHHVFGHGTSIDELIVDELHRSGYQQKEYLADSFAGFLLMPKTAVIHAFRIRDWTLVRPTANQLYVIAGWFGVGYTTLVHHMAASLKLITSTTANELYRVSPKQIRSNLLGHPSNTNLIVVDDKWQSGTVDIQVDDIILAPLETEIDGDCLENVDKKESSLVFVGRNPGIASLWNPVQGWQCNARVARRAYIGRAIYRHLEDPDDN